MLDCPSSFWGWKKKEEKRGEEEGTLEAGSRCWGQCWGWEHPKVTTSMKGRKHHISHLRGGSGLMSLHKCTPRILMGGPGKKGPETKGGKGWTKFIYQMSSRGQTRSWNPTGSQPASASWAVLWREKVQESNGLWSWEGSSQLPGSGYMAKPSVEKQGNQRQRDGDESPIERNGQEERSQMREKDKERERPRPP